MSEGYELAHAAHMAAKLRHLAAYERVRHAKAMVLAAKEAHKAALTVAAAAFKERLRAATVARRVSYKEQDWFASESGAHRDAHAARIAAIDAVLNATEEIDDIL